MLPGLLGDPLQKGAACGHLGRIEEGQACVRNLLVLKPGFVQRGRILIDKGNAFEDIVDRIIEGPGKLRMNIE
ncbi:MAG: hypothetical protein QNJ58_05665 [Desulfobacterales bacterium]|nr:hypothetical protein [Desulfobacterales bacterium]